MPHEPHGIPLSGATISAALPTAFIGKTIIVLDTVPSTNDFAKNLNAVDGPHGTVIVAEEQTSGRGRFGRRWESTKSLNLLISVLLRPGRLHTERLSLLPFAAAVAGAEAIETVTGLRVECKWPNDLLVAKKKVCGMLLESSMMQSSIEKVVLGIGMNVNQTEFPAAIVPPPTSLRLETGAVVDRSVLLRQVLIALEHRYTQLMGEPPARILNEWKSRTTMFGMPVTVRETDATLAGIAEDLAPDGSLLLRTTDGRLTAVRAGDVTLGYDQTFLNH